MVDLSKAHVDIYRRVVGVEAVVTLVEEATKWRRSVDSGIKR